MKHTIKHAGLWASVAVFTFVSGVVFLLWTAPSVEARLFPVVENMRGTVVAVHPDSVELLYTGNKTRSCQTLALNAEVLLPTGQWVWAETHFLKKDGSVLQIEDQRIAAGSPFVRHMRVRPGGSEIKIFLESRCHPLWIVREQVIHVQVEDR